MRTFLSVAERTTWTDERIDDRLSGVENAIDRLDRSVQEFRTEMNARFDGVNERMDRFNERMDRLQDRMIQVGFGMSLALFAALITAILAVA